MKLIKGTDGYTVDPKSLNDSEKEAVSVIKAAKKSTDLLLGKMADEMLGLNLTSDTSIKLVTEEDKVSGITLNYHRELIDDEGGSVKNALSIETFNDFTSTMSAIQDKFDKYYEDLND